MTQRCSVISQRDQTDLIKVIYRQQTKSIKDTFNHFIYMSFVALLSKKLTKNYLYYLQYTYVHVSFMVVRR